MSNLNERQTHPVTSKTRLLVRGATNHYTQPFSRSILMASREKNVKYIVVATSMASQALRTYLRRFRTPTDATVEEIHAFQGDEDSFEGALTGKTRPSIQELRQAFHNLASVLHNMKAHAGRVLVLCQMGMNRSFTIAFLYYICFVPGAAHGKTIPEALRGFRVWQGVSYDVTLQQSGSQRLDPDAPWLPWMQSLARIFHEPMTKKISKARIEGFLSA